MHILELYFQSVSIISKHPLKIFLCMWVEVARVLGLSSGKCRVLGADVALGAGGRLEGHGAAGALVEDLAVGSLDVRLDGVQPSEYDLAARAPGQVHDARDDGKGK